MRQYPGGHNRESCHLPGKTHHVNRKEYVVLRGLLENNGRVFTRERLEEMLYGWNADNERNTLYIYILIIY
ncbi:MAG TPA: helix-turn-helix domain-containing protein [Nitrospiria bacterium]|nr:helix-turn-helix domain-containing protein [Candidatus Manganitrophaceae bacterium]HIL34444.1 helix-turn-helix domain-containing protein [Candidatus Manganitrophaceae bacterium]